MNPSSDNCPCGLNASYSNCCKPLHLNETSADTAEALMRSRFCAYYQLAKCTGSKEREIYTNYLLETHHHDYRSEDLSKSLRQYSGPEWLSLIVLDSSKGQNNDLVGTVEFVAFHSTSEQSIQNNFSQMHENSSFVKKDGRWLYTEGLMMPYYKLSRNDPCWCGSGKKYKKCHG